MQLLKLLHAFFLLSYLLNLASSEFWETWCPESSSTYANNSAYSRNLRTLLSSFPSKALTSVYNFSSSGSGPDTVFGQYLCLYRSADERCKECLTLAAQDVETRCPNSTEAVVWMNGCHLHYSNNNFFGVLNITENKDYIGGGNKSQLDTYEGLMDVLSNLSLQAAFNPLANKSAAGRVGPSGPYALVHCTKDLSSRECNTCLQNAISIMQACCYDIAARVFSRSCFARYQEKFFYPETLELLPPALSPESATTTKKGKSKSSSSSIVAIAVPIVFFVLLMFAVCFCLLKWRARKRRLTTKSETGYVDTYESRIVSFQSLQFDMATVKFATNNFSDDNLIGHGGYGNVYKGVLSAGQEIAVKRLSRCSGQETEEFQNEVKLVATLQHRNLVRLVGFCVEEEERTIICEYMHNKSLGFFLFELSSTTPLFAYVDSPKKNLLDWSRRCKIIQETARGHLYLYEDSRLPIIHRDLKASNVLLDKEMNPKIADFGIARTFGVDQTVGDTSRIKGTLFNKLMGKITILLSNWGGYMSPEYALHGHFAVKSDVYSFGVLILEIISGKRNSTFYQSGDGEDLVGFAWKLWMDGRPLGLTDFILGGSYSKNEVIRCIHIGLLCVQKNPADRPSMATVILMLDSCSTSQPLPQQPGHYPRDTGYLNVPVPAMGGASTNEVSISQLSPR